MQLFCYFFASPHPKCKGYKYPCWSLSRPLNKNVGLTQIHFFPSRPLCIFFNSKIHLLLPENSSRVPQLAQVVTISSNQYFDICRILKNEFMMFQKWTKLVRKRYTTKIYHVVADMLHLFTSNNSPKSLQLSAQHLTCVVYHFLSSVLSWSLKKFLKKIFIFKWNTMDIWITYL